MNRAICIKDREFDIGGGIVNIKRGEIVEYMYYLGISSIRVKYKDGKILIHKRKHFDNIFCDLDVYRSYRINKLLSNF